MLLKQTEIYPCCNTHLKTNNRSKNIKRRKGQRKLKTSREPQQRGGTLRTIGASVYVCMHTFCARILRIRTLEERQNCLPWDGNYEWMERQNGSISLDSWRYQILQFAYNPTVNFKDVNGHYYHKLLLSSSRIICIISHSLRFSNAISNDAPPTDALCIMGDKMHKIIIIEAIVIVRLD